MAAPLYPTLVTLTATLATEQDQIPPERLALLQPLRAYVREHPQAKLLFICTHNSRRSHMAQVWTAVAAAHYGREVKAYSGGTEATAVHPNTLAALRRAGFAVAQTTTGANPRYSIYYADRSHPITCFSKRFGHPDNPQTDFAAVMTCTQADADCPFVPGATLRVSLPYEDPKDADDTPREHATYDARLRRIGREVLWVLA